MNAVIILNIGQGINGEVNDRKCYSIIIEFVVKCSYSCSVEDIFRAVHAFDSAQGFKKQTTAFDAHFLPPFFVGVGSTGVAVEGVGAGVSPSWTALLASLFSLR